MRLLAPAATAVLLLALTGCSEPEPGSPMPTGPAPATSEQPSTTAPTTTASASEPPATGEATTAPAPAPTLPPEATTNDAAGAEAFVRYWYNAFNYAVASGDTGLLRDASLLPECLECEDLAALVEDAHSDGGSLVGGHVEVVEAVAPKPDETGAVLLSVVIEQDPVDRLDRAGAVVQRGQALNAGRSSQSVVIARDDSDAEWLMVGLGT